VEGGCGGDSAAVKGGDESSYTDPECARAAGSERLSANARAQDRIGGGGRLPA
jgi:hypothetical protein